VPENEALRRLLLGRLVVAEEDRGEWPLQLGSVAIERCRQGAKTVFKASLQSLTIAPFGVFIVFAIGPR
jgi:hypothetical protein